MIQSISSKQAKNRLRIAFLSFRFYDFWNDIFDTALMVAIYVLIALFLFGLMLVNGLAFMLPGLFSHAFLEGLHGYYQFCAEEVEIGANEISIAVKKIIRETDSIKKVTRVALKMPNGIVHGASDYITIIEKIRLTRKERKELGARVSSFFLFVLHVITFSA